ncbi:MAG: lipid A biosynthesis acyltransferase [Lewinellaceae bacterium]|nr:hypothetical protein [Lewinella sp.]MCB9279450.1 lipid A biosynthesis acyltransferase [Lewinellaceae bacterium]
MGFIFAPEFRRLTMNQLLYYLIIKPLSLLPLRVLYVFSDLLFVILYHIAGYRKKVVMTNLRNSFPEKGDAELKRIAAKFYHHFCDMMIESIRIFSIPEQEAVRRCKVLNPEFLDAYAEKGTSLICVGAHYANWEMAAIGFNSQIRHWVVGIYSPLKNAYFDNLVQTSRTRYGTGIANRRHIPEFMDEHKDRLTVYFFIGDQSPSSSEMKQYWTTFLHQETGVLLGAEKYAKLYNYPVVYILLRKVKRGYYTGEFVSVEDHPLEAEEFSITEKHVRILESEIRRQPEYWLWTHRRWKHQRPDS